MVNSTIVVLILIIVLFSLAIIGGISRKIEGYRDPIYLNRQKMVYDWYPRSNGSIYGLPYQYGGSYSLFSGYPYYYNAY